MDEEIETPAQFADRVLRQLQNTKNWAVAKADTIESRITAAGGEVPKKLAATLASIREQAK